MKRKRLAAKGFAVIMAISASLPMNSNTLVAYAAENADAVSAEEAESGGTQEEMMPPSKPCCPMPCSSSSCATGRLWTSGKHCT